MPSRLIDYRLPEENSVPNLLHFVQQCLRRARFISGTRSAIPRKARRAGFRPVERSVYVARSAVVLLSARALAHRCKYEKRTSLQKRYLGSGLQPTTGLRCLACVDLPTPQLLRPHLRQDRGEVRIVPRWKTLVLFCAYLVPFTGRCNEH